MDLTALIRKFNTSGPRYTSYPTAPQWTEEIGAPNYLHQLSNESQNASLPLAMYMHIPYCESLCYYCGCNIQITKDHQRSIPYLQALIQETGAVARALKQRRTLNQISWGGGTPTFLTPEELSKLARGIYDVFDLDDHAEVSIEVDPRVTTQEHLAALSEHRFNRISLGVQDFDPQVQKAVNRVQSVALTDALLQNARRLGFKGINFDFMYGLPYQTVASFEKTVGQIIQLKPDRIALYNYAHLPSLRPHQKILEKMPMPSPDERIEIFSMAYEKLLAHGYRPIGMDHFALETDEMFLAANNGTLYRNFMGYTVKKGAEMVGIGASAIGEFERAYFQNVRESKPYESKVQETGFATFRGCRLSDDDVERKWIIQSLMCGFRLKPSEFETHFGKSFHETYHEEFSQIESFCTDGLLEKSPEGYQVTSLGRLFVRNIAMAFDAYLKKPSTATYSKTV